ncbi:hypothetical protein GCM10023200_28880 [Actinomycetospora chlora]|uniref:PASTA domain-containing protein n=1 Tax=Actinomycetospora chlora TaxID=663608 RepID=A0ABP9BA89_9PSEU
MSLLDQPPAGSPAPDDHASETHPSTPQDPARTTRRRRAWVIFAIAAVAVIAFVVGQGTAATSSPAPTPSSASPAFSTPSSAQMPNLAGMTVDAGTSRLKSLVGSYNVYVADGEASRYKTIVSQSPAPGTTITAATRIDFYVTPAYTPSYSMPSYTSPSYSPPTTSSEPAGFGSGTWEVGNGVGEIPPGTYRAAAGSSRCYYERLSSLSGEFEAIIANDGEYDGGPMTVTISSSDAAFKVSGDCRFVRR